MKALVGWCLSSAHHVQSLDRGDEWRMLIYHNMPAACLVTYQLVVGRIVDDIQNTSLPGDSLHSRPNLSARSLDKALYFQFSHFSPCS